MCLFADDYITGTPMAVGIIWKVYGDVWPNLFSTCWKKGTVILLYQYIFKGLSKSFLMYSIKVINNPYNIYW